MRAPRRVTTTSRLCRCTPRRRPPTIVRAAQSRRRESTHAIPRAVAVGHRKKRERAEADAEGHPARRLRGERLGRHDDDRARDRERHVADEALAHLCFLLIEPDSCATTQAALLGGGSASGPAPISWFWLARPPGAFRASGNSTFPALRNRTLPLAPMTPSHL